MSTPVIYYGEDAEEPYIASNSVGDVVYHVPAGYPDLVPILQEQAGAYFWATVHQLNGTDDNVDLETVNAWRESNPQFK